MKVLSLGGWLFEWAPAQILLANFPITLEGFSVGKSVTIEVTQIPIQDESTNKPLD